MPSLKVTEFAKNVFVAVALMTYKVLFAKLNSALELERKPVLFATIKVLALNPPNDEEFALSNAALACIKAALAYKEAPAALLVAVFACVYAEFAYVPVVFCDA